MGSGMTTKQRLVQANQILDAAAKGVDFRQHLECLVVKKMVPQKYQAAVEYIDKTVTQLMNDATATIQGRALT